MMSLGTRICGLSPFNSMNDPQVREMMKRQQKQ